MNKTTYSIAIAATNIAGFWIGFKIWELDNFYLIAILVSLWLAIIAVLARYKPD